MFKRYQKISLVLVLVLLTSCGTPATTISSTALPTKESMPPVNIARHAEPADYSQLNPELTSIPTFDPNSISWQVNPQIDLRSTDLTKIEMTNSLADLMAAAFDSKTQWPSTDKMPADFDPQKIMEIGKDPGLGMRALHEQGITGKGIGIAIIDQTLLVDHVEYKDRIRVYEETNDITGGVRDAQMHGSGIASLAVGKTVGVAPEADLYFIATGLCGSDDFNNFNYSCLIQAIKRIVEVNKTLPADRKIRILSLASAGWASTSNGYDEIVAALNEAKNAGIFVISFDLYERYGFHFQGLGRDALSDPNQVESYIPSPFWSKSFYDGKPFQNTLLLPMDSRTTASPTGVNDYAFYRWGDLSWTIPYLAGTYALAVQVKPDITPEEFWAIALESGRTIQVTHDGKEYSLGVILDPQALIASLQK